MKLNWMIHFQLFSFVFLEFACAKMAEKLNDHSINHNWSVSIQVFGIGKPIPPAVVRNPCQEYLLQKLTWLFASNAVQFLLPLLTFYKTKTTKNYIKKIKKFVFKNKYYQSILNIEKTYFILYSFSLIKIGSN